MKPLQTPTARCELDLWRYVVDMHLIQRAWDNNQVVRVLELLDAWRPEQTKGIDYRGFEWHYWFRLCNDQEKTLPDSTGSTCGTWSPDGQQIAAAIGDRILIWDAASPQLFFTLQGLTSNLALVVYSGDSQRIAALDADGRIALWDAKEGQFLHQFHALGASHYGHALALSPDGKHVAGSCGSNESLGHLKVWEAETGRPAFDLPVTGTVLGVAFSPDGKILATGTDRGVLTLWGLQDGTEIRRLSKDKDTECCDSGFRIACLAFSPDGQRLASASFQIDFWDVATGAHVFAAKSREGLARHICFSRDGSRLAGASDGIDQPGILELWDAEDGSSCGVLKGPQAEIKALAFDTTGRHLASFSADGVKVWHVAECEEQGGIRYRRAYGGMGVVFSPDNRFLVATDWGDGELIVWETATGRPASNFTHGFKEEVLSVAFSPDGRLLAAGGGELFSRPGGLKVWELATGQLILDLNGHEVAVSSLAFSPDGRRLASRDCANNGFRMWDVSTGQCLFVGVPGEGYAAKGGLAFSPDGRRIALGRRNEVHVCDAVTGDLMLTLPSPDSSGVSAVAFSPDGRNLAAAAGKIVPVWDADTGAARLLLKGHYRLTCDVAFAPDGRRLATAGDDVINLWDLDTGQEVLTLDQSGCVAFSPDGRRLATGGFIWDTLPRGSEGMRA